MASPTVERYLESCQVAYRKLTHPHTESSQATARSAHVPADHLAKGVLLADEAGLVLAVVPGDQWLKLHALQETLNRPVTVVDEDRVNAVFTDCAPGALPPLGPAYGLETVLDEQLAALSIVFFEAGDHEHLIEVAGGDFLRLLAGARHAHIAHFG